jgi:hypothetical protein
MQQMAEAEAESVSTVGTPEKIISALNKYIGAEITHFILDFTGLDERCLRVFDSKVIKKI